MRFKPRDESFTEDEIGTFEISAYDSDDNDSSNLRKDFVSFHFFFSKYQTFSLLFSFFRWHLVDCFVAFVLL